MDKLENTLEFQGARVARVPVSNILFGQGASTEYSGRPSRLPDTLGTVRLQNFEHGPQNCDGNTYVFSLFQKINKIPTPRDRSDAARVLD